MKPISKIKQTIASRATNMLVCCLFYGYAMAQPQAVFTVNTTSGCAPIVANFTDYSTGNPTSWNWNLGNGTNSTLQHPSATYIHPGTYTVKLLIRNASGADSVVKVNYITVYPSPVVQFNATNNIGCNTVTTLFTDLSLPAAGNIIKREWDFGDGRLSDQPTPSHTYELPGQFNVTLRITNSHGCVAASQKDKLVKNYYIKAKISAQQLHRCQPHIFTFKSLSVGDSITQYRWHFGDGQTSNRKDVEHRYRTAGNYTVKLITTSAYGCTDSVTQQISFTPTVSAAFFTNDSVGCKAPHQVQFTPAQVQGNTYRWDFGDSSFSTSAQPTHIYEDTGRFTVKLWVKNQFGCQDSLKKINYVRVANPGFFPANLPDSGCGQMTKKLMVAMDSRDSLVSYLWRLPNGITSTEKSPTVTFTGNGYHAITFIGKTLSGCTDTIAMPHAIRLSTKPQANFEASHTNTCASTDIVFTNTSTGQQDNWIWDFGDNSMSFDKSAEHQYRDTGYKTVTLITRNGGCADTMVRSKYVYLKPAVAKFTVGIDCGNSLKKKFNNFSIAATSYHWDFGDGNSSQLFSPEHSYASPGLYQVTLSVYNNQTGCGHMLTKPVVVQQTQINFSAVDTSTCRGGTIAFHVRGDTADVLRYFWDFGDGNTINTRSANITHQFHLPGYYSIRLISVNQVNCRDTLLKENYIRILGPTAQFDAPLNHCFGKPVEFADQSFGDGLHAITNWRWTYGDGKGDTVQAPPFLHSYPERGSYRVSLGITDANGCMDSTTLNRPLLVTRITAISATSDTLACSGTNIRIWMPYWDRDVRYLWYFGDGDSSNLQLPLHQYQAEGRYTVTSIISNSIGCTDTVVRHNWIRISNPVPNFSMSDSFRTCPPLAVNFTNQSTGTVDWLWDFGNGSTSNLQSPTHFYSYPGVYYPTLTVKGAGACTKTFTQRIEIKGPTGRLSYGPLKQCRPYQTYFEAQTRDAASFIWDFNDGITLNNTDSIVQHLYRDSGNFVPKLILIDELGCRVPITGKDTIVNLFVKPTFTVSAHHLCDKGNISFTNLSMSNDPKIYYEWQFGDGTTSTETHPIHFYQQPGSYTVTLKTFTDNGCSNQWTLPQPIVVSAKPSFSLTGVNDGCVPLTIAASSNITNANGLQWQWNFSNGNSYTQNIPPVQIVTSEGMYTLSVTATNANGCIASITDTFVAYKKPSLNITGKTSICQGEAASLNISGAERYQWVTDNTLNCNTCATVTVNPLQNKTYHVKGFSIQGCQADTSIYIQVKEPISITCSAGGSICKGGQQKLTATGARKYEWWPTNSLSTTSESTTTARPDTTTTYRVVGFDGVGCFADTAYTTVLVHPIPQVDAGSDKSIPLGTSTELDAKVSTDVTQVNWTPTDGAFRNNITGITVKPSTTTEYTVEATNRGGCAARDRVTITVLCNNANVFFPTLFSPNGDGVNDVFYPRGTGLFKVRSLRIFSRWGTEVYGKVNFNTNDALAAWDGNYKGKPLPADVYVYIAELICDNNNIVISNGNVTLMR